MRRLGLVAMGLALCLVALPLAIMIASVEGEYPEEWNE